MSAPDWLVQLVAVEMSDPRLPPEQAIYLYGDQARRAAAALVTQIASAWQDGYNAAYIDERESMPGHTKNPLGEWLPS